MPMAVLERSMEDFKARDAARQRDRTAERNDMRIPSPLNPGRRAEAEADDCLWLKTYCPDAFYNPFTPHQERIIADCGEALRYGTQKCKAAPRGDGKSSIVKYLALKYSLCRQVRFPLIIAATSTKAKKTLNSLKRRLASGATFNAQKKTFRLNSPIGEDYPLECCTAAYVDPWPSRARNVTANERRMIHVEWGADWFILPTWEDEEPLGPILLSLGITSDELQGCNIYDMRPDFVMLDDLDSRDSLASEDGVVAGKIEEAIDKTVAGLGGQGRSLGKFFICTITSRESAGYKYSDPAQKPWAGERIPAILKWPTAKEKWEEYVRLRKLGAEERDEEGQPVDPLGRRANQFYLDDFAAMNADAEVSNPFNFESQILPDGSQKQASSLQRCYDYIADNNLNSFLTEHQNDPPEESGPVESGINVQRICKQLYGLDRGVIPLGCTLLTMGIDVGKWYLHWVVRAWKPDATGYTIDYGTKAVMGVERNSDEGLDIAIHRAIVSLWEDRTASQYTNEQGEVMGISLAMCDARYRGAAVYSACRDIGRALRPIMGHGKSKGCVRSTFSPARHATAEMRPVGIGCDERREKHGTGNIWITNCLADQWKAWEHDRWLSDPLKPGCMFLFGARGKDDKSLSGDELTHQQYAKMICGEVEVEDEGKRYWKPKGENHYLDASAYADVGASIMGIALMGESAASTRKKVTIPEHMRRA